MAQKAVYLAEKSHLYGKKSEDDKILETIFNKIELLNAFQWNWSKRILIFSIEY